MGIADWDRTSSRAFRSELNAFLDREAEKEREAEMAEDYAKHLMQKGQECYPWTYDHYQEALEQAPFADRMVAFVTIATAVDLKLDNPYSNHMALEALNQLVTNYWEKIAMQEAGAGK